MTSNVVSMLAIDPIARSGGSPMERAVKLHAHRFFTGRLESLVTVYATPLPFYTDSGLLVIKSKEELLARLSGYRQALLDNGLVRIDAELVEDVDEDDLRRIATLVTYVYASGHRHQTLTSRYLRQTRDGWIVEMMERIPALQRDAIAS